MSNTITVTRFSGAEEQVTIDEYEDAWLEAGSINQMWKLVEVVEDLGKLETVKNLVSQMARRRFKALLAKEEGSNE